MSALSANSRGFSLIDMMITLGIVGALVGIAIPSYNSYVSMAQTGVVRDQYERARHTVRLSYAKAQMRQATGHQISLPQTSAEWIAEINQNSALSPEGGPAYVDAAGTVNPGQIGIQASGTFPTTAVVVITQPSYRNMTARQVTVAAIDVL